MAWVLVLLFAALCGVHTATIPNSDALDSTLDKLDSKLDGLDAQTSDHIKQNVLDGVKRLLDLQLSALVKDADRLGKEGISKKRTSKSKSKTGSRQKTMQRNEMIDKENGSLEKVQQNSDVVLPVESIRDPTDEALRNAVDRLLKDNKDIILEDKDEIILDNNVDNMLELENSTNKNIGDIVSEDAYDKITSQLKLAQTGLDEKLIDSKRKDSKYNKEAKSHRNKTGRNLDGYITRVEHLLKKDKESEGNENRNENLAYQPRRKYGRRVNSHIKKSNNKIKPDSHRDNYKHINDNILATKLSHTETSGQNDRKSWFGGEISKKDTKEKEAHSRMLSKLETLDLGNQDTSKINDAQSTMSHVIAINNEETNTINQRDVADTMGNNASISEEQNKIIEKIEKVAAEKYRAEEIVNNKQKQNDITKSGEFDKETIIFQLNDDSAITDTEKDINRRVEETDSKDVIIENEENINEGNNLIVEDEKLNEDMNEDDISDHANKMKINKNKATKERFTSRNKNEAKRGVSHKCPDRNRDSDESKIIRDLMQNNDIKKSIAFSLNFTTQ